MDEYIIQPLFDNILVLPEEVKKETVTGIILPNASGEAPSIAEVQSTGEGKVDKDGTLIPMKVKAGDRILYKQWGTNEIKMNNKKYLLLKQEDVLALVINKKNPELTGSGSDK